MTLCALLATAAGGFGTANADPGSTAGGTADFNGDGAPDVAVADPEATVSGQTEAGLIRVFYGDGKGTAEIHQDTPGVPGGSERGDRYGHALAVTDWNEDGYSDLVVGLPFESIGTEKEAGWVHVLYGAPGGLTTGPSSLALAQGSGSGSIGSSSAEAGDWMGYSVAAGKTSAGEPYILIGVPGEDLNGTVNAGSSHYLRGSTNIAVHQDKPGVAGVVEENDRFGYAVAGSPRHIAVGNPGEAIGDEEFSGGVQVLAHTINADGLPDPLAGLDQDTPGVNGTAEAGDRFGAALAMVPYRPSGASSASHSLIAVGSPGEALPSGGNTGRVVVLEATASGAVRQTADIHQNISGVAGLAEDGDHFGQHLAAVNTAPGSVGTSGTLLLAAGIPGEDLAGTPDAGAVQVFPLLGAPGDADAWVQKGSRGLPGTYGKQEFVGTSLFATPDRLFVGLPYGAVADRGVHGLPWQNLTSGAEDPATSLTPGSEGLPTVAFGSVIR